MAVSWEKTYAGRLTTADRSVAKLPARCRVVLGHAAGAPQVLEKSLVDQKNRFRGAEIVHMVCLGPAAYAQPGMERHFRHNAFFVGAGTRRAIAEDRGDYTPCFFHEVPRLFREGMLRVDAALICVSRPDAEGYCSFGVSCDYTKPAAEAADLVLAEANDRMPFVGGDNMIHISRIDHIVETSVPVPETMPIATGDVEKAIGEHCASLIEDGSTLQMGIGGIPNAVLSFLKNKHDLGVHSEMFSDGIIDLIEEGVVNGRRKTLHPGLAVATFLMGTQHLYDYVHHNERVKLFPVDYVNSPAVIMQNDKMVSINSCIEVDLMGQVVSETIGPVQFSGVGGQVDFVRGANLSKGGKSIIALPSTAAGGQRSRIVSRIADGAAVTTSRNDADYIVTEYGIARMKGQSLRQRAQKLIAIAHPDFQEELIAELQRRFPGAKRN